MFVAYVEYRENLRVCGVQNTAAYVCVLVIAEYMLVLLFLCWV